jgi:hypothetical protein
LYKNLFKLKKSLGVPYLNMLCLLEILKFEHVILVNTSMSVEYFNAIEFFMLKTNELLSLSACVKEGRSNKQKKNKRKEGKRTLQLSYLNMQITTYEISIH